MRVLLVAPDSSMEYGRVEVDRVVTALRPTLISGAVTVSRLLDVREGHKCVWFIAHGGEDGIELSDGVMMSLGVLGSVVSAQGASLVVLNTCESLMLAQALNQSLGVAVVATVGKVGDLQAYVTGAAFAGALASGNNAADAYAIARPIRNSDYIFIPGGGRVGEKYRTGGGVIEEERLRQVEDGLRLLKWRIEGNNEYGLKGLGGAMEGLEERLDRIEAQIVELVRMQKDQTAMLGEYVKSLRGYREDIEEDGVVSVGWRWATVLVFFVLMLAAGITIWNSLI